MSSYLLGYDLGSSSVKVALVDADTNEVIKTTFYPKTEMDVISGSKGWAEQHPEVWWENLCYASQELIKETAIDVSNVKAIGIAYQMHGLVILDEDNHVLRPSIIWSDSRAVEIGNIALKDIGAETCYSHLLNAPGNFTLSKLKWVYDNEPKLFAKMKKFLLPGDFIAMKMTGEVNTTVLGLSEAMAWDFKENKVADFILKYFGFNCSMIPEITPTFSNQGTLHDSAAKQLGLKAGVPVTYRAGDQPNNALALNVTRPGEIAATGGTSGVVYAVVDKLVYDNESRVNSFAHVNHTVDDPRIGVLLCINGAGSQYAWMKRQIARDGTSYQEMEQMIDSVPVNSDGLRILPFGNGAERMLNNKEIGSHMVNLQFNRHSRAHMYRAALEGIAFSFVYGIEVLKEMNIDVEVIRVGDDNLFQSSVFSTTIASLLNCRIEVVKTTGAVGAAYGAGYGAGLFSSLEEALKGLKVVKTYFSNSVNGEYRSAFDIWKSDLNKLILAGNA